MKPLYFDDNRLYNAYMNYLYFEDGDWYTNINDYRDKKIKYIHKTKFRRNNLPLVYNAIIHDAKDYWGRFNFFFISDMNTLRILIYANNRKSSAIDFTPTAIYYQYNAYNTKSSKYEYINYISFDDLLTRISSIEL